MRCTALLLLLLPLAPVLEGQDAPSTVPPKAEPVTIKPAVQPPKPAEPAPAPPPPEKKPAAVSTMLPEELDGIESYPAALQGLVRRALMLTTLNLRYQFGSSSPEAGGMDCSGTMFRLLNDCGLKEVPRQSDEFCRWVMRGTVLYRTEKAVTLKEPMFSALRPGDLLFWTGTYTTSTPRELPVSHVMIYLGKRKKDGRPVVFGASDGRTYDNERRNGVSIFDFSLPRNGDKSAFFGYGPVPGLDLTAQAAPPQAVPVTGQ